MALAASRLLHQIRFNSHVLKTTAGDVVMANEGMAVINKTSGQATQVTLTPNPTAVTMVMVVDAKGDAATNRITVVGDDGDTINGGDSFVIATNYGFAIFAFTGTEWNVVEGSQAVGAAGTPVALDGVTVLEFGDAAMHKTVFLFDAYSLATLDNGTAGSGGGVKLYDFPQGVIRMYGSSQNWELLTIDGTGLPNDVEVDIGVGTTLATSAMGSLTTTTQDIVPKDDITFSSSVSAEHQFLFSVSGGKYLDGSATAKDAYLNLAATAATADGNGTIAFTGTVEILWSDFGVATS